MENSININKEKYSFKLICGHAERGNTTSIHPLDSMNGHVKTFHITTIDQEAKTITTTCTFMLKQVKAKFKKIDTT